MGTVQISRVLCTLGLAGRDWSAEYRQFSRSNWDCQDCFDPVIAAVPGLCLGSHIDVAGDFTHIRKSGRKIAGVRLMRDPASDIKWNTNLIYGLQYLQLGLLVPVAHAGAECDERIATRCLPVHFSSMPTLKKPGKNAPAEQWRHYRQEQRQRPAMAASREAISMLRNALDKQGANDQILSIILDGSFANRTLLAEPIERTHITCRCRRNARLRFGNSSGQPGRFYAPGTFTPDSIRTDHATYPHVEASIRLTTSSITIRYKDIGNVYWPGAAKRRPLRLLMVAQTHHKARGTKGQAPTFDSDTYHIITTDLERPAHELIQAAFDRWQIEVAHREQKTVFGIGDAQVRNAQSVQRHPAFAVACYSLLHLAAIDLNTQAYHRFHAHLPKWRKRVSRPSIQTLLNLLRMEIQQNPSALRHWDIKPDIQRILHAAAA
jgi:hypothetical protein